jgi:hypothetical protein
MTNIEPHDLIRFHKPQCEGCDIGGLLAEQGNTVITPPTFRPDINILENIWGVLKSMVAEKLMIFKLAGVKQMAKENV